MALGWQLGTEPRAIGIVKLVELFDASYLNFKSIYLLFYLKLKGLLFLLSNVHGIGSMDFYRLIWPLDSNLSQGKEAHDPVHQLALKNFSAPPSKTYNIPMIINYYY